MSTVRMRKLKLENGDLEIIPVQPGHHVIAGLAGVIAFNMIAYTWWLIIAAF